MSELQKWSAPVPLTAGHPVADFACGEPTLDHWLKHRALRNEGRGASRTYVLCTEQQVVAYYCLATGSVASQLAPGRVRRNMPDPIPVMILGRLAVDLAWQRHGLGKALLRDAILRTMQVSEVVGVRALLVHALSEQAVGFYEAQPHHQSALRPSRRCRGELQPEKAGARQHGLPRLRALLEALPPEQRPALVRGDCAFGNDRVMAEMEDLEQFYLFKLHQTAGVKRLIERLWSRRDWQAVGHGFDAVEARLQLSGWRRARRVVVLRRRVKEQLVAEVTAPGQQTLLFADAVQGRVWEYAVLVTNTEHPLEAMGQLCRDRADCENRFDEPIHQWGWGGYTTQDLERCNLSARAVALIYNWWSWYVRLAHPQVRREAMTSRPLLLAGVARLTEHAGQSRLLLTLTHAASDQIKAMIANIRKGLDHVRATAPQLPKRERWRALIRYIVAQTPRLKPGKPPLPLALPPPLTA